jgi:hypothetical protein
MPDLPGMSRWYRGLSVEAFQCAELSHVLRVFFFRVVQSFQDHRLTSAYGGVSMATSSRQGIIFVTQRHGPQASKDGHSAKRGWRCQDGRTPVVMLGRMDLTCTEVSSAIASSSSASSASKMRLTMTAGSDFGTSRCAMNGVSV